MGLESLAVEKLSAIDSNTKEKFHKYKININKTLLMKWKNENIYLALYEITSGRHGVIQLYN